MTSFGNKKISIGYLAMSKFLYKKHRTAEMLGEHLLKVALIAFFIP